MADVTARAASTAAAAADEALLKNRLRQLGVRRPVVVHENRTVLVSVGRGGHLRVHRGYAYASDRILRAIIRFVNARNRGERAGAERELLSFHIDTILTPRPRRRRQRASVADRDLIQELERIHSQLNAELFGGALSRVPFRISNRMRTRLGEVTVGSCEPRLVEITISRRHWERDGRAEVEKTLLHEMVHQWQAESGLKVDHGPRFRKKAKEVGAAPLARRAVEGAAAARER